MHCYICSWNNYLFYLYICLKVKVMFEIFCIHIYMLLKSELRHIILPIDYCKITDDLLFKNFPFMSDSDSFDKFFFALCTIFSS